MALLTESTNTKGIRGMSSSPARRALTFCCRWVALQAYRQVFSSILGEIEEHNASKGSLASSHFTLKFALVVVTARDLSRPLECTSLQATAVACQLRSHDTGQMQLEVPFAPHSQTLERDDWLIQGKTLMGHNVRGELPVRCSLNDALLSLPPCIV